MRQVKGPTAKDESSVVPILKSFAPLLPIVRDLKPNPVGIRKENRVIIRRVLRVKLRRGTDDSKVGQPPGNRIDTRDIFAP